MIKTIGVEIEVGSIECAVIGAGVVGLAIAAELAAKGREVLVLEAERIIGSGISSRNSEVIHAGLYYPSGSLKAQLCHRGRDMLYSYCDKAGIAHRRCGKLVVATAAEECHAIERIYLNARSTGVPDLELWTGRLVADDQPEIRAVAALYSGSTGIVDSHGLMLALQGRAEDHGAAVAFASPLEGGSERRGRPLLRVGGEQPIQLDCNWVINCAGLGAERVARGFEQMPRDRVPHLAFAKGSYFSLLKRAPASRLIYPAPSEEGLGIHLTLDLAGRARFGPDVEWVKVPEYEVDQSRAAAFERAIRRYWPALPENALSPDYAGIRPKLAGPGQAAADFRIEGPKEHGCAGLVHLFGIESPGLTASLAIAEYVERLMRLD